MTSNAATSLDHARFTAGHEARLRLATLASEFPAKLIRLGTLLLTMAALGASAAAPKRVLILDSFGRDVAPFSIGVSAFRTTLARELGQPVDIYEVSLDMARFPDPGFEKPLTDFLDQRLAASPVDLVVPVGAPAIRFVMQCRDRLFAETQMVFMGCDPRRLPPGALEKNTTLVTGKSDHLGGVLDAILQLKPDTTNVVFVAGISPHEKFWTDEFRREWQPYTNRLGFSWLNDLSLQQMQDRVRALPPRSAIFVPMLLIDAARVPYDGNDGFEAIHAVANAPVFGCFMNQLGKGAIGGWLYQDDKVGTLAARVAIRILRGERATDIQPEIIGPSPPTYDWRELTRWDISPDRLPAGSVIKFREPTFWQQYRWHIIVAMVFCCLQTALIVGLLVNRAERRQAEKKLHQSSEVLERSPAQVVITDTQGEITYVNRTFTEVTGYSYGEVIGQNPRILKSGESPAAAYRELWAAITQGQTWRGEFHNRKKNGELFWEYAVISPLRDEAGKITHFVAIKENITERKRAEQEIAEQRNQLTHLSRVNMLGELAGSLAHELNQPLTAVLSNAQAAQRFLAQDQTDLNEVKDILADIVAEDKRAGEVIHRLRLLLKKGEVQQQPLDVNEIVGDVLRLVHSDLVNHNCTAQTDLAPHLPVIRGDRVQLQQVLLNLVTNACDAMAGAARGERQITIQTRPDGEELIRISAADYGTGIKAEKLEQVFEPFYTTKAHGMGLGLSVCRTIITAHGGKLWAVNNPGRGATFHVSLPVAKPKQI